MHLDLVSLFEPIPDALVFHNLELPLTEEEINEVVKEPPNEKSLGPDGFNAAFLKNCWDIIAPDFYKLIADFYSGHVKI